MAVLAACTGSGPDSAADARGAQDTVRRSLDAENRADVPAFLALWTDDGLRSYDAGSRSDLESGKARLGVDKTEVADIASTTVKGNAAEVVIDTRVEAGLYRLRFDLLRQKRGWLLNGFGFLGPTPPPASAKVVEVKTVEYGYDVDKAALASGDFAVKLTNEGKEQHEIAIVTLPPAVSTAEAVLALLAVRGTDFSGMPAGYTALGHLAYAPPGNGGVFTLAGKLPPGRYAMVCLLPVGGVDDLGNAKVANADTHVARGMLTDFTVG
jgi:hypothetical protein